MNYLSKKELIYLLNNKEVKEKKKRNKYDKNLSPKYKQLLMRANNKGLEINISEEEFYQYISQPCSYCGKESSGLDRIDYKIGYTHNNVTPCCYKCNMMKHTFTKTDFLEHIKTIYNYQQSV